MLLKYILRNQIILNFRIKHIIRLFNGMPKHSKVKLCEHFIEYAFNGDIRRTSIIKLTQKYTPIPSKNTNTNTRARAHVSASSRKRTWICMLLVNQSVLFFMCVFVCFFLFDVFILVAFLSLFQVYMILGDLVMAYAAAFVLSLAFEAPMMGLEKVLLGRNKNS